MQQPRGALVRERALVRGHVLVDGRADQRVHERHRRVIGEHLGADELRGGRHRGGVVEAGELGDQRQRGRAAEHGGRARHRGGVGAEPADPDEHGARGGTRRDRVQLRHVRRVGRDALGAQRLGQLDQQQRVPARRVVTRAREHGVGAVREQRGAGARAQRLRLQGDGDRVAGDLADQVRVRVALVRPDAAEHGHAQVVEPAGQVAQPAQRRLVAPLQIVDHQQQRLTVREGDRQAVERVQDRERHVLHARAARGPFEDLARRRRGAFQQRVGDRRLEQLAHDTERQPLLELAPARAEHPHVRVDGLAASLPQQPGLADPRRPFDDQEPGAAVRGRGGERSEHRQLVVALEQHGQILGCTSGVCRDVPRAVGGDRLVVPMSTPGQVHCIHLELRFDGSAPIGHVWSDDGGDPRTFSGWVGLVCAVEELVTETRSPTRSG